MTKKSAKPAHNPGSNPNDKKFSQSRDIREDRGQRQMKVAQPAQRMQRSSRGR